MKSGITIGLFVGILSIVLGWSNIEGILAVFLIVFVHWYMFGDKE